jgi:hypothetical protein
MRMSKRSSQGFQIYWTSRIILASFIIALYLLYLSLRRVSNVGSLRGANHERDEWITEATQPFVRTAFCLLWVHMHEKLTYHIFDLKDLQKAESLRNLIVVAGHSMTLSGHLHDADADEADWYVLEKSTLNIFPH